jgi:hypothetical protein
MHKEQFIKAIQEKQKIQITFFSKEDNCSITRKCAPMDYGPSKKFKDGIDRFHVWDYFPDGGKKPHPIPIEPLQIQSMVTLGETFDPSEFITWNTSQSPWHVQRDWGQYS